MPRKRNLGVVSPLQKIWLSKKELAKYLGVSERYIEANLNMNPKVRIFRLSERTTLYNRENIDAVIMSSEV